jgi:hypothetical protein
MPQFSVSAHVRIRHVWRESNDSCFRILTEMKSAVCVHKRHFLEWLNRISARKFSDELK